MTLQMLPLVVILVFLIFAGLLLAKRNSDLRFELDRAHRMLQLDSEAHDDGSFNYSVPYRHLDTGVFVAANVRPNDFRVLYYSIERVSDSEFGIWDGDGFLVILKSRHSMESLSRACGALNYAYNKGLINAKR